MTDYEVVPTISVKFGDKIKYIKSMFSKHYMLPTYEAYWPANSHYLFTTPESFLQHHEQFDKLWTLFNEIEFGSIWSNNPMTSYYEPSFNNEIDYLLNPASSMQYYGSNYYRYPSSNVSSKYGEFFGNDESFKPYKPYLSRGGMFTTSYVPSQVYGLTSNPIDKVIGELEVELAKIKLQKELPYEFQTILSSV